VAERVWLYMDYQNVHLSVREAFAPSGTPHHTTLIHPGRYGDALMARRAASGRPPGTLEQIHVYRGQPSSDREPLPAGRNKAQSAEWLRDRRVTMYSRPLRYPRNWPNDPAREKGVDVKLAIDFVRAAIEGEVDCLILASRDTDLVPALEAVSDLKRTEFEVVTWQGCSRVRFGGAYHSRPLWCTFLQGADYVAAKDPRQYP
jgi:uncharacterized LabA/DUF88 family protein